MSLEKLLKQYSHEAVIEYLARCSVQLFYQQIENARACGLKMPIKYVPRFSKQWILGETILFPWDIHQIQHLAILNGNSHKKKIQSEQDVPSIVNAFRGYSNKKVKNPEDIFLHVVGFSFEQFKFQRPYSCFLEFERNYHILIGSDKIKRTIPINDIVKEKIGITARQYFIGLASLWVTLKDSPFPENHNLSHISLL